MKVNAGQIGQWALFVGALACAVMVMQLTESRPTVTYTQLDDQQVVVSCAPLIPVTPFISAVNQPDALYDTPTFEPRHVAGLKA